MLLSILIPTLPEPFNKSRLKRMMFILNNQINHSGHAHEIEVLTDDRGREIPTGTKRNDLLARAQGIRFCYVDDDDRLQPGYINSILTAAEQDPDVITFEGFVTTNGKNRTDWVIRLGEEYETRNGVHYRFPNHLSVMKRELVQHVKFPDITYKEDFIWACAVNGRDPENPKIKTHEPLLKSSVHIPRQLYHYEYISPEIKKKLRR